MPRKPKVEARVCENRWPYLEGHRYTCSVYIDEMFITDGYGETKKAAKLAALGGAQEVLNGWGAVDSERTMIHMAHTMKQHQERNEERANQMAMVLAKWRPLMKDPLSKEGQSK